MKNRKCDAYTTNANDINLPKKACGERGHCPICNVKLQKNVTNTGKANSNVLSIGVVFSMSTKVRLFFVLLVFYNKKCTFCVKIVLFEKRTMLTHYNFALLFNLKNYNHEKTIYIDVFGITRDVIGVL